MTTPTPETDAETLDGYMPIHVSPEGKCYVPPWLHDPKFGYVMCPFCGGRIIKEGK